MTRHDHTQIPPAAMADARDAADSAASDIGRLHPPVHAGVLGAIETWHVLDRTVHDMLAETIHDARTRPDRWGGPVAWDDIADILGQTVQQVKDFVRDHTDKNT